MNSVPNVTEQPAGGGDQRYTVAGAITSRVRASIGMLNVQLVDKNIGGDEPLADTTTGADGAYAFKALDLAARRVPTSRCGFSRARSSSQPRWCATTRPRQSP